MVKAITKRWEQLALKNDAKSMAFYTFSNAFSSALGLLLGPLILGKVGLSQYGMLGIAQFTLSVFYVIADFGIQSHLVSVYSRQPARMLQEVSNCFYLKLLLLAFVTVLYAGYSVFYPHPAQVKNLLGVFMFTLLVSPSHLEWVFISQGKYSTLTGIRLTSAFVNLGLTLLWYFFLGSIWYIPILMITSQAVAFIGMGWKSQFFPQWPFKVGLSLRYAYGLAVRLAPMAGTQVFSQFFLASGIFLLEKTGTGPDFIGAYSISHRIILGLLSLIVPMVLYFIPKSSQGGREIRGGRTLIISCFLILFFYVSGFVLIKGFYFFSAADARYFSFSHQSYLILLFGLFFNILRIQYVSAFISQTRYKAFFLIHFFGAFPVIILAALPILKIPPLAAVATACVPEFITTLLIFKIYYSKSFQAEND